MNNKGAGHVILAIFLVPVIIMVGATIFKKKPVEKTGLTLEQLLNEAE